MTPRPRAPTLRAVANLTIRIPDELMQRLLSATPPLDVDEICTCALQEALRRRTVAEKAAEQTGTRRGRPPKGTVVDRRIYRSVGLAQSTWELLDAMAAGNGVSVNDAIETLVIRADTPPT